ncbi:MAG TPA: YHYH protein, partial [Candidatus Marinimicrobia bacterium]|nr:YHYH protein [Candidatus Neomarinimicrobiota bacterium]
ENNPDDFASDFGLEMGRYEEDWYFAGTGNLDECNGAYDVNGNYGYYITDKYPFTPPCTFGARNSSFGKKSPTM